MTSIDRRYLSNYLRLLDPRSSAAAKLELEKQNRLDADGLDQALPPSLFRGPPSLPGDLEAMNKVRNILRSPNLYDIIPVKLPELLEITQVVASKRGKRPKQQLVPSFSSMVAPRIAQTAPGDETHSTWSVNIGNYCYSMPVLSPDAEHLYVFDQGGRLMSYDPKTGNQQWTVNLGQQGYATPVVSPDGQTVYAVGGYGNSTVWAVDVKSQSIKWQKTPATNNYNSMCCSPALSPDGKYLYVPSLDYNLYKYDAETGEELGKHYVGSSMSSYYGSPCVSPDGSRVAVRDGVNLIVLDTENLEQVWSKSLDGAAHSPAIYSDDGKSLYVSGSYNLYAFDAEEGTQRWSKQVQTSSGNQRPVLSRDGSKLYIGDQYSVLHVFETEDGEESQTITPGNSYTLQGGVALNHDETKAYGVDTYGKYYEYDLENDTARNITTGQQNYGGFSMSPDGRFAYQATNGNYYLSAVQLVT